MPDRPPGNRLRVPQPPHVAAWLWGHGAVSAALQGQQRRATAVHGVQGATPAVDVAPLGQRCDQAIDIAGLELVRVGHQGFQVCHAVMVDACREAPGEGQGGQHSEAAGTAAAQGHALSVDPNRWLPDGLLQRRRPAGRRRPTGRASVRSRLGRSLRTRHGSRPPQHSHAWSGTAPLCCRLARRAM